MLQALGAGGVLAAMSGSARAQLTDDLSPGEIYDQWGFPAASQDVEPYQEPDYQVNMYVENRPGEDIPYFFFQPTGLYIRPGQTVKFNARSPHHTITAYHEDFGMVQRVPPNVPAFSSPAIPQGGYWLYTFDDAGVYDLHCAPHEAYGMAMRIVVGSRDPYDPLPNPCDNPSIQRGGLRLPLYTSWTVLRDEALDPSNIIDRRWVGWGALDQQSKQLYLQPVGWPTCPSPEDEGDDGGEDQ
jgi:plastocyanin